MARPFSSYIRTGKKGSGYVTIIFLCCRIHRFLWGVDFTNKAEKEVLMIRKIMIMCIYVSLVDYQHLLFSLSSVINTHKICGFYTAKIYGKVTRPFSPSEYKGKGSGHTRLVHHSNYSTKNKAWKNTQTVKHVWTWSDMSGHVCIRMYKLLLCWQNV